MRDFAGLTIAILAAGLATRFGADKLEQPLAGLAVGLHAARSVGGLPFPRRVAICAAEHGIVPDGMRRLGFEVLLNPAPQDGQSGSLALSGRAAREAGSRGLVVCLADMPRIDAKLVTELVGAWGDDPTRPVVTVGGAYRGPPVLLPRAMFEQIAALRGDRGARELLAAAQTLAAPPALLIDIDRPDDLAQAGG